MNIVHLYSGSDGKSHFRDIEVPLGEGIFGFELPGVEGVQIRDVPDHHSSDFHTAPRRMLILQLMGSGETDCGDGEVRVFGPGEYMLADDRTGRGHKSREVSGPRQQMFIYISEDVEVSESGFAGPSNRTQGVQHAQ